MIEMLPTQEVGLKTKAAPSNPAASKLRQDSLAARRTLIGLCVKLVEGGKVTDSELAKARVAADATAADVAAMIDTLEQRKAAHDQYHGRDWAGEIAANKDAIKEARAECERLDKELAQLREAYRQASEQDRSLIGHGSRLRTLQNETRRELSATLGKTGDRSDWRSIH